MVGAVRVVARLAAVYGDPAEPQAPLLEDVGDAPSYPGLVHEQLDPRSSDAVSARVVLVTGEGLAAQDGRHPVGYLRVRRPQRVALQVPQMQEALEVALLVSLLDPLHHSKGR